MKYDVKDVRLKTCKGCSQEFRTFNNTQLYCTSDCRIESAKPDIEICKEVIFRRDGYKCVYCGSSSIEDGIKLHMDHVYPISKGGQVDLFNLVTSCSECNTRKHNKILPQDVILRIWERNDELNKELDISYEELKSVFSQDIKNRLDKLNR